MKKYFLTALVLFFVTVPTVSSAYNFKEVINNVVSSVNTGGNTAESGEVIEGETKSSVQVYTEVNGEVIEDFQKDFESGEDFEYSFEKEFEGGKTETQIQTQTEVQNQTQIQVNVETTTPEVSNISDMSKRTFDTIKIKVKQIINYVFKIFKF